MMKKSSILFLVVIFLIFFCGCRIVVVKEVTPVERTTTVSTSVATSLPTISLKDSKLYKINFELLKEIVKDELQKMAEKERPFMCCVTKKDNQFSEIKTFFYRQNFENMINSSDKDQFYILRGYSKEDVEMILAEKISAKSSFGYSVKKLNGWGDYGYLEIEIWNG